MKRIPLEKYSKEFREEAVKHVTEQGLLGSPRSFKTFSYTKVDPQSLGKIK